LDATSLEPEQSSSSTVVLGTTFSWQRGNDILRAEMAMTILACAGDDVMPWNPGDDNDTLEGQAGFDTLFFNGANIAENIDISANGAGPFSATSRMWLWIVTTSRRSLSHSAGRYNCRTIFPEPT
jgi:Ca2+-binding RTX toxin-like protein